MHIILQSILQGVAKATFSVRLRLYTNYFLRYRTLHCDMFDTVSWLNVVQVSGCSCFGILTPGRGGRVKEIELQGAATLLEMMRCVQQTDQRDDLLFTNGKEMKKEKRKRKKRSVRMQDPLQLLDSPDANYCFIGSHLGLRMMQK